MVKVEPPTGKMLMNPCPLIETLNRSRCFERSERWNERWQVESSSGRDLYFFFFFLWLTIRERRRCGSQALTAIDAIKLPASRQQSTGSLRSWWDVLFRLVSEAEAKKGNRVFISFTVAEINWCKRAVFGLSSSVTSTITMFTLIYKCPLDFIHLGRRRNLTVVKVCPLFNDVVTT